MMDAEQDPKHVLKSLKRVGSQTGVEGVSFGGGVV